MTGRATTSHATTSHATTSRATTGHATTGLAGTGAVLRLALRRDRVLIPLCVLGLVALAGSSAQATVAVYTTPAAAVEATRAIAASPALVAMYGPIADPDNPDSVTVFKTFLMGGVFLALLAFALVRRHTRTDEESGRTELLGAGVLGRRAPLAAAVVLAGSVVVLTAALATASLVAAGVGTAGSVAFGLGWAGIGLTFTAVTAVAAQLTETSRGCSAWALGALGLAYVVRAVGDTSSGAVSALTWLSPLGWAEKLEMFGANRYAVVVVPLVVTALLLGLAFTLLERRDLGAGLLPTRPGPASAEASLRSPLALAWRLQRGALTGWVVGFAVLGFVLGGVATNITSMVDSPEVQDMLRKMGGDAATFSDIFLSTEVHFIAVAAAAYGISAALRLRSEETGLHSEQVLATGTTRRQLLASHSVVALAGSALLMVVFGVTLAAGYGRQSGGVGPALGHLLPTALAPIPAVWVCVGLALAIFGSMPKVVYVAWALLAGFLVVGEFGPLLGLPTAAVDLSPFSHGAVAPGSAVQGLPLVVLLAIAAGLVVASARTFRRRDIG